MSIAGRLKDELGDDSEDFMLALDSETDVYELLDRIIEQSLFDGDLVDKARARAARIEKRYEKARDTAERMLEALDLPEPLERALYTASLTWQRHVVITGPVPGEYTNDPTPNKRKIAKALRDGETVENAELSNAMPSLTVRTR